MKYRGVAEFPTDNYGNRVSFFREEESSKYSSINNNNKMKIKNTRFLDLEYLKVLRVIVLLYEIVI